MILAACGTPVVVERVIVVPKVVERPVFTERLVIVEKPVVVEKHVAVTRLVTPSPTAEPPPTPAPTARPMDATATARTEVGAQAAPVKLRAAISPNLVRDGRPDLGAFDSTAAIELEVLDGGSSAAARLLARAAAGDLPDVLIGVPGSLVMGLDELEMLASLDAALGPEQGFLPEMTALGLREDRQIGMPITGHATHLLASRERLDRAGVADVGSTYDDLGDAARRLTDPETYRYGFGVVSGLPELETVTRSAGPFPESDAAVAAWQWYQNLWLQERVSPPPNAWDSQGGAGETVVAGHAALAIVHGRALSRLERLPLASRAGWEALPLPGWGEQARQVPLAAAFTAARRGSDMAAIDAAVALAGPSEILDMAAGIPAWTPLLDDTSSRLGMDLEQLLESREAWTAPLVEGSGWRQRAASLDAAIHSTLVLGEPAEDSAARLEAELAEAATIRG
jgi:ABC-type glycerol-3-phosphate transport system substrate-binding protein